MYMNKAIIVGNVTRDVELKSLPSGAKVAEIGVATNRTWTDQSGNKQDQSEFHNVVAWGRTAEVASQYLKKGSGVLIEGRLQTRTWDGECGKKHYRTEIVAERLQLGARPSGDRNNTPANKDNDAPEIKDDPSVADYPEGDFNDEDIPF